MVNCPSSLKRIRFHVALTKFNLMVNSQWVVHSSCWWTWLNTFGTYDNLFTKQPVPQCNNAFACIAMVQANQCFFTCYTNLFLGWPFGKKKSPWTVEKPCYSSSFSMLQLCRTQISEMLCHILVWHAQREQTCRHRFREFLDFLDVIILRYSFTFLWFWSEINIKLVQTCMVTKKHKKIGITTHDQSWHFCDL